MAVTASPWFHAALWILLTFGLVGNVLVVLWRCTRQRELRWSVLSIMIIILAVSDFVYCLHLVLLEGYLADAIFGNSSVTTSAIATRVVCNIGGNLSVLSSSTVMWMTLNVAIYAHQALSERNCCSTCCLLADRKCCLCITLLCQFIFITMPITGVSILFSVIGDATDDFYAFLTAPELFVMCSFVNQPVGITLAKAGEDLPWLDGPYFPTISAITVSSLNALLAVACAGLYLSICVHLRGQCLSQSNRTCLHSSRNTEVTQLQWRFALIVLISIACWVPVTAIHGYAIYAVGGVLNYPYDANVPLGDFTAASVVLTTISPAINPLIYSNVGRQFVLFVQKSWRYMRCRVSLRCPGQPLHVNDLTGVRRCSCIPCIQCIRPLEYIDPDKNKSEVTGLFTSDDRRSNALDSNRTTDSFSDDSD